MINRKINFVAIRYLSIYRNSSIILSVSLGRSEDYKWKFLKYIFHSIKFHIQGSYPSCRDRSEQ